MKLEKTNQGMRKFKEIVIFEENPYARKLKPREQKLRTCQKVNTVKSTFAENP